MQCDLTPDEAYDRIAQIIGCKWSAIILASVSEGTTRPSAISRQHDDLAPRVLHRCLNRLERDGLIEKHSFSEVPPRVEYSLTENGDRFLKLLHEARQLSLAWEGDLKKVRA